MKILFKRSELIIYDAHIFTTKQPRVNFNAWFRRRTSHEPNRIHWIKFMRSTASESIRNGWLNSNWLSRELRLSTGFDSDAYLHTSRNKHINQTSVFLKYFEDPSVRKNKLCISASKWLLGGFRASERKPIWVVCDFLFSCANLLSIKETTRYQM